MFLALVIVALLIYLVHQSSFEREINSSLGFLVAYCVHGGAVGAGFIGNAGARSD